MMISFTAYANKKFDILQRHGCVITREDVLEVVSGAIGTEAAGQPLFFAQKKCESGRAIRVAYRKEAGAVRVITFYPISCNDQ